MVNFSKACLFFVLAGSTASGAIINNRGMSFTINGIDSTSFLSLPTFESGNFSFLLPKSISIPGLGRIETLGIVGKEDPFINYLGGITNTTNAVQTYSFGFFDTYVGGPYNLLRDSFTDSFTDGNSNGTVTIGLAPAAVFIAQPQIDGTNRDGLGVACTQNSIGGFSGSCNTISIPAPTVVPTTPANGNFGVVVSFTLSPGDLYTFNGRVELTNSTVPEPATYGLLGAGLVGLVFVARRRRSSNLTA